MRVYEGSDGAELHADLSTADGELRVYATFADGAVSVSIADLEAVVGELYRAAGKQPPLILPQPPAGDLLAAGPHGEDVVTVTPSPSRSAGNLPGVLLEIGGGGPAVQVRLIGHEPMRLAGALINAMREAEREPYEAEVEALVDVLADASMFPEPLPPLYPEPSELARVILRAGYKRDAS